MWPFVAIYVLKVHGDIPPSLMVLSFLEARFQEDVVEIFVSGLSTRNDTIGNTVNSYVKVYLLSWPLFPAIC